MPHAHTHPPRATIRVRLLLGLALAPFVVATLIGLATLWPAHRAHSRPAMMGAPVALVDGTVTGVDTRPCQGSSACETVQLRLTSGPDRGHQTALSEMTLGPGVPNLQRGDHVVLGRSVDATGRVDYYFADYQRRQPLAVLALMFAVVVVGVARWRGLGALAGLAVAWAVLMRFVIPALLDGEAPLAVALIGSAVILFIVMYLAHGPNARTSTALLGTLISLAATGALAAVFVGVTRLTGLSSDEMTTLQFAGGSFNFSGLVLAGVVIGSLGVLNDVTVTQASAVWELRHANPSQDVRSLYRGGMRIGRDHIASTVYTLVLAYAGASLPLLLLFTLSGQNVMAVLTGDLVAQEIVRTLIGSIGLVASVPITTAVAAAVVSANRRQPTETTHPVPEPSQPPTPRPVEIVTAASG